MKPGQVGEGWIAGTEKVLETRVPVCAVNPPVRGVPVSDPLVPVVSTGVKGPTLQVKPSSLTVEVIGAAEVCWNDSVPRGWR